jgi:dihydroorotate dehydrogenase (NAD+) catalytic subunit
MMFDADISVDLGGLPLANPVMLASGTAGYGSELNELFPIEDLGALVTKGISKEERIGNPSPRIVETPSGMINSIGLQNVGLKSFIKEKLPFLQESGVVTIVNILGSSVAEYADVAGALAKHDGIHAIELNISCPNVKEGGVHFGSDPAKAAEVVVAVKKKVGNLHVMVKLSPQCSNIAGMAQALEDAGANSLSLINTIPAMVFDVDTGKPVLPFGVGGLSGPAIRPVAVRMVHEAASAVKIPIVGIGGIRSLDDMLQFFWAGASAVQIGTANFIEPGIGLRLVEELGMWLDARGAASLEAAFTRSFHC